MGNIEKLMGLESPLEVGNKINEIIDTSKSVITNCLLEVPQRIKYELADGILTIKAGTVVIVPYGTVDLSEDYPIGATFLNENFEVYDTQYEDGNFFVWGKLRQDKQFTTPSTASYKAMLYLKITDEVFDFNFPEQTASGTTTPETVSNGLIWYDVATNKIKKYYNDTWQTDTYSLPIGLITRSGNVVSEINQIFDCMGYFGSTFWLDKGVIGLMPDGRNADGTLKNIVYKTEKLHIKQFTSDYSNIDFCIASDGGLTHNFLIESEEPSLVHTHKTYIPSRNIIVWRDGSVRKELYIGKGTFKNKAIVEFIPHQTFRATNAQDIDGCWTYKHVNLVEKVTDFKANDVLTFDLSDYLPDTINVYEILCSVTAETGTTNGDFLNYIVASDIIPIEGTLRICAGKTFTDSMAVASGSAIIPCRKSIILNNGSTSIGTSRLNKFDLIAYRKVR